MKYRWAVVAAALFVPAVAWSWPWSTDMADQPSIEPQHPVAEDRLEMYPFPDRSVPVGGVPTTVANRDQAKPLANPIPASEASVKKGRTLFRVYCAACHGLTGRAESPVSSKIGAPPLNGNPYIESLTDGWIWGTISFGSYIMPAYGVPQAREDGRGSNDLDVEERWHVVNYIRHGLAQEQETQPPVHTAEKQ